MNATFVRIITGLGAMALSILSLAPPAAAEGWVCAYPGYSPDARTTLVRFNVDGDELVDSKYGHRHKILQNNEFSLIAVWSISEIEPNNREPSIGAFVVIIGKRDGSFRRSNAMLDEKHSAVAFGSCEHEP